MEIKAVVVGGPRDLCAGDRSSATNPLAGFAAFAEPLTTIVLASEQLMAGAILPVPAGPQGSDLGGLNEPKVVLHEVPHHSVACSVLPEAELMFFLLCCTVSGLKHLCT